MLDVDHGLVPPPLTQARVGLKRTVEELLEISEDGSLLTLNGDIGADVVPVDSDDTDMMQVDESTSEVVENFRPVAELGRRVTVEAAKTSIKEEKAPRTTASVRLFSLCFHNANFYYVDISCYHVSEGATIKENEDRGLGECVRASNSHCIQARWLLGRGSVEGTVIIPKL